jgi:hypothetical protein
VVLNSTVHPIDIHKYIREWENDFHILIKSFGDSFSLATKMSISHRHEDHDANIKKVAIWILSTKVKDVVGGNMESTIY